MDQRTALSTVVVSYNTREETLACIASLDEGGELLLVDNASADGTAGAVRERFPGVRVLAQTENLGFAKACNLGARAAANPYLAFVNSDCLVRPGCLDRLARFLDARPDVAIAVPRLVGDDGAVQRNATVLPTSRTIALEYLAGRNGDPYALAAAAEPVAVESVSGAVLVIRAADFAAVGGFHEGYFMYVEDVELSRRIGERGRGIAYVPDAVAFHAEGGSSAADRGPLTEMLHRHREDYVRRTMPGGRAALTIAAMRAGRRVTPLRDRLLATARRRRP